MCHKVVEDFLLQKTQTPILIQTLLSPVITATSLGLALLMVSTIGLVSTGVFKKKRAK